MNIKNTLIFSVVITVSFSGAVLAAQEENGINNVQQPYVVANRSSDENANDIAGSTAIVSDAFILSQQIPAEYSRVSISRIMYITSTGYNSEVGQTDNSPFITANGEHVYWGGAAANFLPFGTKIKIPDYYGDQIFTINDRMNRRYWERVDVWFPEKPDALKWGVRKIKIEILG